MLIAGEGKVLDATVRAAAQALAQKLRESQPIDAFWQARARLEADDQARGLLAELQERQQTLALKQQAGGQITQEEIDALRRLQGDAQSNPIVGAYLEALQQAQAFLPEVNLTISELLGFDFGGLAGAASG